MCRRSNNGWNPACGLRRRGLLLPLSSTPNSYFVSTRIRPSPRGNLLPGRRTELQSLAFRVFPLLRCKATFGDDLDPRQRAVVHRFLAGRRNDVLLQLFILLHAFGQSMTTIIPHAVLVLRPDRGAGRSRSCSRARRTPPAGSCICGTDQRVGVRAGNDVIGDDVLCLIKPEQRASAIQYLSLVRDRAEVAVEAALAVSGNQNKASVAGVVRIPDLAFMLSPAASARWRSDSLVLRQ